MTKTKLKKGDTVLVIAGTAKGKQGKIIQVDVKKSRALVEGVNLVTKSEKPNAKNTNGGIVKKEGSIHLSNLMFVEGGKPVKLGAKLNEKDQKKERISRKSKEAVK